MNYKKHLKLISLSVFTVLFFFTAVTVSYAGKNFPVKKPSVSRQSKSKDIVWTKNTSTPSFSLSDQDFNKVSSDYRLSKSDAAIYSRIFALQDVGNTKKANKEITKLENYILMGHVLYQRYIGKYYRSSYRELANWMNKYYDHAGANKIYKLALKNVLKKEQKSLLDQKDIG